MRYAITGAGMLGRALAAALRTEGHETWLLDVVPAEGVRAVDLSDPAQLRGAFDGADGVFHTAALHGWRKVTPREFFTANVVGTWNVLEECAAAGITRLVQSSTVGVYGPADRRAIGPDTDGGAVDDPYDVTKWLAEQSARFLAGRAGIQLVALRYGGFRELIEAEYGSVPEAWAASGALVNLADAVTANVQAMARLPLPRPAYVVAPTAGDENSPFRVDASATETDLDMTFGSVA